MGWLGSHVKVWAPVPLGLGWRIAGPSRPDASLLEWFRSVPSDPDPRFEGVTGMKRRGRGRDHPRYGRFLHAFGRHVRPREVVEVGTFAGGTAVAWARALLENGSGKVTCVDNDSYAKGIFPDRLLANLDRIGFPRARLRVVCGDSKREVPALATELAGKVDVYLVDADHTYEGALADLRNGMALLRPGGFVLVHDLDPARSMPEATPGHPHPVLEAFRGFLSERGIGDWYVLEFIRKHLGVARVPCPGT